MATGDKWVLTEKGRAKVEENNRKVRESHQRCGTEVGVDRLGEIKKQILAVRKDLNAGRVHHDERETVSDLLGSLAHVVLKLEQSRVGIETIRVALGAYPDSNLESLAKLYRDIYTFRMARCDSGDCETLEMYRRRIPIRIERSPVCLGCGKTYADCKCTDEQIEYHKRLEREQKAE